MTKEQFLKGVDNFDNHRHLLWQALEATEDTKGLIIEMGMGYGSTPYLSQYSNARGRELISFDNNKEWIDKLKGKFDHRFYLLRDWDFVSTNFPNPDVVLIDHAPGERRWEDIKLYANSAKIIVIHDSEPAATGYMLDKIWGLFKYRVDYKSEGAWASAVSNFVDVTKWKNALSHDNQ